MTGVQTCALPISALDEAARRLLETSILDADVLLSGMRINLACIITLSSLSDRLSQAEKDRTASKRPAHVNRFIMLLAESVVKKIGRSEPAAITLPFFPRAHVSLPVPPASIG